MHQGLSLRGALRRSTRTRAHAAAGALALLALSAPAGGQQKVHFTYLWHMEQPIYWPEKQANPAVDRYERAWETIVRLDAGGQGGLGPQDNLRAIFSVDDRVAAYQYRVRDAINDVRWAPEAGAQVSYSGGLIENIMSLGGANQLGYGPGWMNPYRDARTWLTSGANARPRLDIVQFSFHHALLPLLEPSAVRKELQLYKRVYADAWGAQGQAWNGGTLPAPSRGLFPSEMAFSERLIPQLAAEGIAWSVVSAEKIARAQSNFPVVFGSGGINCDPPNRADQLNPASSFYFRQSISRGCGPAESAYSLTPRRARYVDPATGAVSSIIVVPASQSLSWQDGSAPLGLGGFDALQPHNDPARPMLVVLAHDGDNFWGGGYSYYREAMPNLVSSAGGAGYVATTVEKYLADHPVPADDFAKVEDGAWVNADGCFGSPQFLNWNFPPMRAGAVDIQGGWAEDIRNWSVIVAAQNRIDTAEQLHIDAGGSIDVGRILYPGASTNAVERAWHYFLGGLNSGFMYYGTALDMENKPAVSSNRALTYIAPMLSAGAANDRTAPTIFPPQRHPWNPGGLNFGPQHGYRQVQSNGDFTVWSFVNDVSGLASVALRYRLDADGTNATGNDQNETYAGGPDVGAWQTVAMTERDFPVNNFFNDPGVNYYATPSAKANLFWANLTGIRSALVDYYIEATDARGNTKRSPISSVWVGDGQGATGGGGPAVAISPAQPAAGQSLAITYDPSSRPLAGMSNIALHWGINNWTSVISGVPLQQISGGPDAGKWRITISVPTGATSLQFVFNNATTGFAPTVWDNNGGADWRYTVTGGTNPVPTWTVNGSLDADAPLLGSAGGASLWAGVKGDVLYMATEAPTGGRDRFLLFAGAPGALRGAMWAKAGQVAQWDAFIGAEVSNTFAGWNDAGAGVATQVARGTHLEGTINIRQELGLSAGAPLPASVRVALGVYDNPDAGALITAQQPAPAGALVANASIEGAEYFTVNLRAACGVADIAGPGQTIGFDGQLTADDIIVFVGWFFALDARADVAGAGQSAGADGQWTADDLIVFVNAFFAGC